MQWSSVFPSNHTRLSVERVPRGFLLLLVNLDTKTKDEFYPRPNSDTSLSWTEKLHQMHSGSIFREELRDKACKDEGFSPTFMYLALTGKPHSPSSPAKGPKPWWLSGPPQPPKVLLLPWASSPARQSTESLAAFQQEWAQISGKKRLGSNKSRSCESKIYIEHKYLIFQLVWFALWWVWVLQGLACLVLAFCDPFVCVHSPC